jgi:hypothetical protein
MNREQIVTALEALSTELERLGVSGEVCLFGGTVMVLAFGARESTRDVDAIFQPSGSVRQAARRVADDLGLPADWLNDGVKAFISSRHEEVTGHLPQYANLRLTMPTPEYLLAMKCMAARIVAGPGEPSDVADIRHLIDHLGLRSAVEVLDLVAAYYPAGKISVRTQYLVESLFEEEGGA